MKRIALSLCLLLGLSCSSADGEETNDPGPATSDVSTHDHLSPGPENIETDVDATTADTPRPTAFDIAVVDAIPTADTAPVEDIVSVEDTAPVQDGTTPANNTDAADCEAEGEGFSLEGPHGSLVEDSCPDISSESYYCMAVDLWSHALVAVGLDSGEICSVVPDFSSDSGDQVNLAWLGDHVYGCNHSESVLTRASLSDGTIEVAPVWCEGVTSWNGGLLTHEAASPVSMGLMHYPTYLDAQCQNPTELGVQLWNTRFTAYQDLIYSAWHSTDEVDVHALPSGDPLVTIALEDYDGWIHGMSVIDGGLMALNATGFDDKIVVFDLKGAVQWEVAVEHMVVGLTCVAGAGPGD